MSVLKSVVSLASGVVCALANMAACDGLLARESYCLASFDEGAAGTGVLVGDLVVIRPKSSVLDEDPGGIGSMFGDVVRIGRSSEIVVAAESDDGAIVGYDGACTRCGYDGRAVGSLGGKRGAVLPYETERLKELVWLRWRRNRYNATASIARSHRTNTMVVATKVVMDTEVARGWRGPIDQGLVWRQDKREGRLPAAEGRMGGVDG